MEELKLKAVKRSKTGSADSNRLRKEDFVPAIVYGRDMSLSLKIKKGDLLELKRHHFSENLMINMSIEGENEPIYVLIKDLQYSPITGEAIHIDFKKISMEEEVSVKVPLEVRGEAKGIKEGGALEHHLWELEIRCLPRDIPSVIEVDVSELSMGESIHVSDLSLAKELKVLTDSSAVIVNVSAPMAEEVVEEGAVEGEASAEPEVLKEKPKVEGEAKEKGKES